MITLYERPARSRRRRYRSRWHKWLCWRERVLYDQITGKTYLVKREIVERRWSRTNREWLYRIPVKAERT